MKLQAVGLLALIAFVALLYVQSVAAEENKFPGQVIKPYYRSQTEEMYAKQRKRRAANAKRRRAAAARARARREQAGKKKAEDAGKKKAEENAKKATEEKVKAEKKAKEAKEEKVKAEKSRVQEPSGQETSYVWGTPTSCPSTYQTVNTKEMCEEGARKLKWSRTKASQGKWASLIPGCFKCHMPACRGHGLYFNGNLASRKGPNSGWTKMCFKKEAAKKTPRVCCKAMTASCRACAAGLSVEEYCKRNKGAHGCVEKPKPIDIKKPKPMPCPMPRCAIPMMKPGCKMESSNEKNSRGCPRYPCGKVVCDESNQGEEGSTSTDGDKDLDKHTCSGKAIKLYDSCRSKSHVQLLNKENGHTFKNVKGVVSLSVPEGCKVTLYTETVSDKPLYADKSSHGAIIKGPKRVCVANVLKKNVVVVGIEDDGDLADVVGKLGKKMKLLEAKLNSVMPKKQYLKAPEMADRRL